MSGARLHPTEWGDHFQRCMADAGEGDNLAGPYSLVATCEANGVNPLEYLADVLVRVNIHPNKQINELSPHL